MKKLLLVAFGIGLGLSALSLKPAPALADACDNCVSTCIDTCDADDSLDSTDLDHCRNVTCAADGSDGSSCASSCATGSADASLGDPTSDCDAACGTEDVSCNSTCVSCASAAVTAGIATSYMACIDAAGSGTGTAAAAPVTSTQSTIDAETKAAAASYWFSLVPAACQGPTGCDICQITLIFTNAANIIGAILSALSLLMFILGGMLLIFSAGVESRIELGRKILIGTVSGLAIVFLAWFVVNLIVRLAASSANTPNGLPDSSKAQIFSADWWNPPSCEPKLPATCFGLTVGALCGGSSATECSSSNPVACSCFRKLDTTNGDDIYCGGTADTDITTASSVTSNESKQCFCASGCHQYAILSGQSYACTETATVSSGSYTTNDQLACPGTMVCAKAN